VEELKARVNKRLTGAPVASVPDVTVSEFCQIPRKFAAPALPIELDVAEVAKEPTMLLNVTDPDAEALPLAFATLSAGLTAMLGPGARLTLKTLELGGTPVTLTLELIVSPTWLASADVAQTGRISIVANTVKRTFRKPPPRTFLAPTRSSSFPTTPGRAANTSLRLEEFREKRRFFQFLGNVRASS